MIAFTRRGNLWVGNIAAGTERQVTNLPEGGVGAGVPIFSMDGKWLTFVASRGGLEPEDLPWNGPMVRSMENVNRERRLGVVAVQGGDVYWVPTVGAVSFPQFTADRSLVYYELSPDGKTKDIKIVDAATRSRACCGATTTTAGCRRPTATSSCWCRPTASSSRSSAIAAAGFTST